MIEILCDGVTLLADQFINIISIMGFVFALLAFLESRAAHRFQENQKKIITINVVEQGNTTQVVWSFKTTRELFSRQEVQGLVGTIKPGERYEVLSMQTAAFFERINQIKNANGEQTLSIDCTSEEISQLKAPKKDKTSQHRAIHNASDTSTEHSSKVLFSLFGLQIVRSQK